MTEVYKIPERSECIKSETKQRVVLTDAGRQMVDKIIADMGSLKNLQDTIGCSYTPLNKLTLGGYCHPAIFDDVYKAAKEHYERQPAA